MNNVIRPIQRRQHDDGMSLRLRISMHVIKPSISGIHDVERHQINLRRGSFERLARPLRATGTWYP